MKHFRLLLLVCIFCSNTAVCFAQTRIIDSLKRRVTLSASKEEKVKALLELCSQKYSLTADSLYHYASSVKKVSQNEKNIILADYYLAYSLMSKSREDSSLRLTNYYLEKLRNNKGEQEAYMLFLQLKGTIFYRTNRSKETINTYYDLLNIAQQQNDTLFILLAKRGISLAYIVNGQDREGLKIFHSAEQLISSPVSEKYKEAYGLLQINAAISYLHLHQVNNYLPYADSCEYYGNEAVVTGRGIESLFIECQGLVVKGVILSYKKKIKEAEENLQNGLEVRKIIGDTLYIISDMSVLASFYANTKQSEKGVALCNTGIEIARKRKITPALLLLLYQALAENYKSVGLYKEYAETLKLQMGVKDSLNIKNSTDELKDLEIKYDLQKQENTIIQQKLNITKKNYWLYGAALFSVMALAILWLGFRNYRRKQSAKMKLALAEEKRIALQSVKDAEEHERKRIAADLHDNLGVYAASLSSNLNYLQPGHTDSRTEDAMQELKNNSNAIISELNDTIWVLKKDALSLTAISDRVKVFISRIQKSYPEINIEVKEQIETDFQLPASQAFHLYRVIQEGVNNCLKHSHGKNVIVEFIAEADWKVLVKDDGMGIKELNNITGGGNGLVSMKERSKEAGWEIKWMTTIDRGTIVQISPTTN